MDIVSGIVVYILLWWWVFLMSLPFGVRPDDVIGKGHATSAPKNPRILMKALITTCIALVLWFGVRALILSELFSFREI